MPFLWWLLGLGIYKLPMYSQLLMLFAVVEYRRLVRASLGEGLLSGGLGVVCLEC